MRIRVIWAGKTKDAHLRALQAEFATRITHFIDFSVEELQPRRNAGRASQIPAAERRLLEKLHGSTKILLDERGREWTSEEFAQWIGKQTLGGTRDLAFVVGGRNGFSAALRRQADVLLALSRLTLTQDWARTLLLEQIYRSFASLRGYPYAR